MLSISGIAVGQPIPEPDNITDGPTAGPIPVLTLALTPTSLEAEVSRSQLGAVTFQGTATVDQMRVMHSTVTLNGIVNTGWPIVVSPQTLEFNGPGEEPFTVSVVVPPATSALMAGNVIVTGSCKAPGLAPVVSAATAVVTVSPYYLGAIISEDPEVVLTGGEKKSIEVIIRNDGNSDAQMRLYVRDKPADIQVTFSETEFHILQDDTTLINVTVAARSGVSSGDYPLILMLETDTRDGGTEQLTSFNVTVYVPSIRARLGFTGMVTIGIVIAAAVGVTVLWKMGKLERLKGLKLPKRRSAGSD
jgi:hypothetical protein